MRQDGTWDGCCQSAIIKEIGAPVVHTDQIKQFLGSTCTTGFVSALGMPGGLLITGPLQTVVPSCGTGADVKSPGGGGTTAITPSCPQGQTFDLTLNRCVPTLDPFNCGNKCASFPMLSSGWAECIPK